jgi:hypothetical protein
MGSIARALAAGVVAVGLAVAARPAEQPANSGTPSVTPPSAAQPVAPATVPTAEATSVPPADLPLLYGGDLRFLGTITLPDDDGQDVTLHYGGHALGMGADGASLYYSCVYASGVARVSLPDIGGRATLLERCRGVSNLTDLDRNDPNPKALGGVLAWNGRIILSGYAKYDAGRAVTKSHWAGPTIAEATGPFTVGDEQAGIVGGYMGIVPDEWRALLGGPALTGQCCISIISRSSYGPTASVFDPDDVGVKRKVPAKMLVGYPDEHQGLGPYDRPNQYFNSSVQMGGVAFPSGTRSVLFIGRHGAGYCYGEGTKDPALHLTPHPVGSDWCYDPTNSDKGPHGYPYRHFVWAYDASELVAVKQGRKAPWTLTPYTTMTLTEMSGGTGDAWMNGAVYDHVRRRIYIVPKNEPVLYVYGVGTGTPGA